MTHSATNRPIEVGSFLADDLGVATIRALMDSPQLREGLDLPAAVFFVRGDDTPALAGEWNFGRLDVIADQLEHAADRLDDGQRWALVRSAIRDEEIVPSLLIDGTPNDSEDWVLVGLTFVSDMELADAFPIPGQGGPDPQLLYDWLTANGPTLYTRPVEEEWLEEPAVWRLQRREFIDAIRRAASEAREFTTLSSPGDSQLPMAADE